MTRGEKAGAFVAAFLFVLAAVFAVVLYGDLFTDGGASSMPAEPPHATAPAASTTPTTEEPVTTTSTTYISPPQMQVVAPPTSISPPAAVREPPANVWDQLAQCESGGDWATNTGNGYYGGLQIASPDAVGMSREQQIEWAIQIQARQGWGAWPACSSKLGLR